MTLRSTVALALILAAANVAQAAMIAIPDTNVLTDGTMEYLTLAEVGAIKLTPLEDKLAAGVNGHNDWRLGTRAEFYAMVRRHLGKPIHEYAWNDCAFSNGSWLGANDIIQDTFESPALTLARSGDPDLARELRDLILMFGGINADPAFVLGGMGTADHNANGYRYVAGSQAYYISTNHSSISRNNLVQGPASADMRDMTYEDTFNQKWFVVRSIPEPTTLALLGMGALALLRRPRRP